MPPHPDKLRWLVDQHFDFVWRMLRRLGVREADTDDRCQRVFITVAGKLDQLQPGKERAFLYKVAAYEAGHARRTYRRKGEVSEEALADQSTGQPRPDEQAGRREAAKFVAEVLDVMEEDLRVVLVLFEVEELTAQEIADTLDLPLGTVKSRLRRAREEFADRTSHLRTGPARRAG